VTFKPNLPKERSKASPKGKYKNKLWAVQQRSLFFSPNSSEQFRREVTKCDLLPYLVDFS